MKTCTECGCAGATLRRDDAADEEHWFHPRCWQKFLAWLRCSPPQGGESETKR